MFFLALAGVAQWTECRPVNWRDADSIPSQGTSLGCRLGPQLGACGRQLVNVCLTRWCFSPSPSPSLPFPLKINKTFKKFFIELFKNKTKRHLKTSLFVFSYLIDTLTGCEILGCNLYWLIFWSHCSHDKNGHCYLAVEKTETALILILLCFVPLEAFRASFSFPVFHIFTFREVFFICCWSSRGLWAVQRADTRVRWSWLTARLPGALAPLLTPSLC